mmetsp:Transcript_48824/g.119554  ORF Transcript_48824/g.119554 Transcript_48824/m.119554 type:complete len:196 (-) Transcript_48824:1440-2027(-)
MSSSCVPRSTMRPLATTAMMSALRIVLRRCAITTVVRPTDTRSSASCTMRSERVSSADVASSSSSTRGLRRMARAIDTRCFWPPDSCAPPSPRSVSKPSGNLVMKSYALASLAACSISARVTARLPCAPAAPPSPSPSPSPPAMSGGAPYAIFSAIVPDHSIGSCCTRPMCARRCAMLIDLTLTLSTSTSPPVTS